MQPDPAASADEEARGRAGQEGSRPWSRAWMPYAHDGMAAQQQRTGGDTPQTGWMDRSFLIARVTVAAPETPYAVAEPQRKPVR